MSSAPDNKITISVPRKAKNLKAKGTFSPSIDRWLSEGAKDQPFHTLGEITFCQDVTGQASSSQLHSPSTVCATQGSGKHVSEYGGTGMFPPYGQGAAGTPANQTQGRN